MSPHIAIVAGEISGDYLGAQLIAALKALFPNASFSGIAGPKMREQGCQAIFPTEDINVMGLFEVIPKLKKILRIRRAITQHYLQNKPDIFIGVDAPDFNLSVECELKKQAIKTVHYVSPTVWAWRQRRIHKIKRACDLMLTLFPFENNIYQQHDVPVVFVGHPLADDIPLETDKSTCRSNLALSQKNEIIALLPGSRFSEVKRIADDFILAAQAYKAQHPQATFVAAMAKPELEAYFAKRVQLIAANLPITLIQGKVQEILGAADAVLVVSGTATLETMLIKRPMVVAYKANALSLAIARRLVKLKDIALPNILAKKRLVPELLQEEVTPQSLVKNLEQQLHDSKIWQQVLDEFTSLHHSLKRDASKQAAQAISELLT